MQEQIEQWLRDAHIPRWAWNIVLIVGSLIVGWVIKLILSLFVRKQVEDAGKFSLFFSLFRHLSLPVSYFLQLFILNMVLPIMRLPKQIRNMSDKALEIALMIVFAWTIIRFMRVTQDFVYYRFDMSKADNLRERRIRTQLLYIRRVMTTLIIILTIAAILLSFNTMRKIGAGLLTGVGVGGIIIGFAAQKSLSNLLAGFQIAFTQPIRLDDVVIVQGQYGTVEEITLTYVVVRIWDERRLILPINYFLENPFENWTRTGSHLLTTVYIYTDYTIPVESVRQEFFRLLSTTPLWDERAKGFVVTSVKESTVELRALMSARNSGQAFDLHCYIREKLIEFVQKNYPDSLPKTRISGISNKEQVNNEQGTRNVE
jgi:small-conductance mechanosensitive channel